jgi:hypothetical protein
MATVRIFINPLVMTNSAVVNALPVNQYLINTITNYTTMQPLNLGSIPYSLATNTLVKNILQPTTNSYTTPAGTDKLHVLPAWNHQTDAIEMKGKVGQAMGLKAQYGVSVTSGWEIESAVFGGFTTQFRANIASLVQQGWLGCELGGSSLSVGGIISFATNS